MRAKEYQLMARCVEDGVNYGFNRAHKHLDAPTEEQIKTQIYEQVMNEICECFVFDREGDGE
jgi:hypothetical protein